MYSTFQQRYILFSESWQIDITHLLLLLLEQCKYTMSPSSLDSVESNIYNCHFCMRKNPVAQLS